MTTDNWEKWLHFMDWDHLPQGHVLSSIFFICWCIARCTILISVVMMPHATWSESVVSNREVTLVIKWSLKESPILESKLKFSVCLYIVKSASSQKASTLKVELHFKEKNNWSVASSTTYFCELCLFTFQWMTLKCFPLSIQFIIQLW